MTRKIPGESRVTLHFGEKRVMTTDELEEMEDAAEVDARYFKRFQHRNHRIRHSFPIEKKSFLEFLGIAEIPEGFDIFTFVKRIRNIDEKGNEVRTRKFAIKPVLPWDVEEANEEIAKTYYDEILGANPEDERNALEYLKKGII